MPLKDSSSEDSGSPSRLKPTGVFCPLRAAASVRRGQPWSPFAQGSRECVFFSHCLVEMFSWTLNFLVRYIFPLWIKHREAAPKGSLKRPGIHKTLLLIEIFIVCQASQTNAFKKPSPQDRSDSMTAEKAQELRFEDFEPVASGSGKLSACCVFLSLRHCAQAIHML